MFTGIVEEIGLVKEVVYGSKSIKLTIKCEKIMDDVKIGDSIAVNGICLTVASLDNGVFTADVMPQTMRKTNLGSLRAGEKVNLERALRPVDRMGGHIVSGHIDGTGVILSKEKEDNAIWLEISAPSDILKYIVVRGSVALDGVSLTAAYVDENCFKVSLIPHTASVTILGSKKPGDRINIECDMLGKYVEKLMSFNPQRKKDEKESVTMDFLREHGFA
ncbi:riboflavin synthase [Acetivibrio straminisolvens]|nr:riboflavin synthase [Acetivibrio straminisolvens]